MACLAPTPGLRFSSGTLWWYVSELWLPWGWGLGPGCRVVSVNTRLLVPTDLDHLGRPEGPVNRSEEGRSLASRPGAPWGPVPLWGLGIGAGGRLPLPTVGNRRHTSMCSSCMPRRCACPGSCGRARRGFPVGSLCCRTPRSPSSPGPKGGVAACHSSARSVAPPHCSLLVTCTLTASGFHLRPTPQTAPAEAGP